MMTPQLPETTCVFHETENKLVLFFPLTKVPYRVSLTGLSLKWAQLLEVLNRVAQSCKTQDSNYGPADGRYYASVSISKEEWEWVLTHANDQKVNSTP